MIMRALPGEGAHDIDNDEVVQAQNQIVYLTNRINHIHGKYSQVHEIEILQIESDWRQEVDNLLLLAGTANVSRLL